MDITLELKQVISKDRTHSEIIEQFKKELKVAQTNSLKELMKCEPDVYMLPYKKDDSKNNEEENINKKIHIFKALEIEDLINDIYDNGLFSIYSINKIEVYCADLISESDFQILFFNNEEFIKKVEPVIRIQNLTSKFKNFSINYFSNELKEADMLNHQSIFLKIDKDIGETVKELLLSNELKVILDTNLNYVQLNKELGNSNANSTQKIKI